jgi:hypothetical protein
MTNYMKAGVLCFGVAMSLLSASSGSAQQKKPARPAPIAAPIPPQILTAKKVFIANGGGDESFNEGVSYTGGAYRAYNEFYAAMQT